MPIPFIRASCPRCSSKETTFDVEMCKDTSYRNRYDSWEEVEANLPPEDRGRTYESVAICRDCGCLNIFIIDDIYEYYEQEFKTTIAPMNIKGCLNNFFDISILHYNNATGVQEFFIGAGKRFDFFKAISNIFSKATKEILIVDPYLDEKIFTNFALLVKEKITISLLETNKGYSQGNIQPALTDWVNQYGNTRPVELRTAPNSSLHDRVVIIDKTDAWVLSQSFKNIATRADGNIMYLQQSNLKIQACSTIWNTAKIRNP